MTDLNQFNSPSIIIEAAKIQESLDLMNELRNDTGIKILYPLKTASIPIVLELIANSVNGFAVSSCFEARLANTYLSYPQVLHFTSPSINEKEAVEIFELSDIVCFNSSTQLRNYFNAAIDKCEIGLRLNTQLRFVEDVRYDPCRIDSKLGISVSNLEKMALGESDLVKNLDGLLIHTNCESQDFRELLSSVNLLEKKIPTILEQIKWINLGGGYLFDPVTDLTPIREAGRILKNEYNLEVFFEPGKGIVGEAGYIISTVVDVFESGDKNIAILDTTVNHMPEVFEYQYKPSIMQESATGKYLYILGGASCLAGDLFGEYSFDEPLKVGSKIVFEDMGAYTLVKAHMFNGINLPTIYLQNMDGELELIREFDYEDFLSRCGAKKHDTIRKVAYDIKAG